MKKRQQSLEFKTTYMSDLMVSTLGNHALSLPVGHPARAAITVLIGRWVRDGKVVTFPTTGPETELSLVDPFAGLEELMEEAA